MQKLLLEKGFREINKFNESLGGWQEIGDTMQRKAVLVSNNIDRFETVIEPKGYIGRIDNVPVDVNHSRQHSGAYLSNIQVEKDLVIPWMNGETKTLKSALTGIFVVPKTARWFYTDRDGKIQDNGSLYELAKNNRLIAPSVDFISINSRAIDGILHYLKWDLRRCSLLTITPGQQDSGWVRSIIENIDSQTNFEYKQEFLTREIENYRKCFCLFDKDNILDYTKYKLPYRKLVGSDFETDLSLLSNAMQEVLGGDLTDNDKQEAYKILYNEYRNLGIDDKDIPKINTMPEIKDIIKDQLNTDFTIQSISVDLVSEGQPMLAKLSMEGEGYKLDSINPVEVETETEVETEDTEVRKQTTEPDQMDEVLRALKELQQRMNKYETEKRELEPTPEPEAEQEAEPEPEVEQIKEDLENTERSMESVDEPQTEPEKQNNVNFGDYIKRIKTI